MDEKLWEVENYLDFLAERRELMAEAANQFLDGLLGGEIPEPQVQTPILDRIVKEIPGGIESDKEEEILLNCNIWMIESGLPEGEMLYELCDDETGKPLAMLDLAWPNGIQEGLSKPVALLINEGREIEEILNREGYTYFSGVEDFKNYVKKDILN
jgi:hypothetical protein